MSRKHVEKSEVPKCEYIIGHYFNPLSPTTESDHRVGRLVVVVLLAVRVDGPDGAYDRMLNVDRGLRLIRLVIVSEERQAEVVVT